MANTFRMYEQYLSKNTGNALLFPDEVARPSLVRQGPTVTEYFSLVDSGKTTPWSNNKREVKRTIRVSLKCCINYEY